MPATTTPTYFARNRATDDRLMEHGEILIGSEVEMAAHVHRLISEPNREAWTLERLPEPDTINIEPDWDGMRRWVLVVFKTDPELARHIASKMGSEAPEFPEEQS